MERLTRELKINLGTLKAHGSYVDKIILPEFDAFISITVSAEKEKKEKGYNISK